MIPQIKLPYYPIKLPDNGRTIHIKPYTIEVEKYMVMLENKNDNNTQLNAIAELLKFCIIEDDVNIDELYIGTLFWLYLKCYEISVKEDIEFIYTHKCENKGQMDINIKIKDIEYTCDNKPLLVELDTEDGKYIVEFEALKFKNLADIGSEDTIKTVSGCISRMYDISGNNELNLTSEDKDEIVKSLSLKDLQKVSDKIQNIAKPKYTVEYECPACGEKFKETIEDFFI